MPDIIPISDNSAGPVGRFQLVDVTSLRPSPNNARKHTKTQIRALAKSIETFGFAAPILVDKGGNILAGHARLEAAKELRIKNVPVIYLDHLNEFQARAYMLADNKLTDRSSFDEPRLALELKELSHLALDFDIEATGFEAPEIDFRVQSLENNVDDVDDDFEPASGPAVSMLGDIWHLGNHRICCGDALQQKSYATLMGALKASAVFTDPPYNVKINGHVSGKGKILHREFSMAVGEMSEGEFTEFLTSFMSNLNQHTQSGSLLYVCMDWRHMREILAAGASADCDLLSLCVWVKSNGGMGSLYRSRHELVFVFKNGSAPHLNNIQLGKFGRNRSTVWNYGGANSFARRGSRRGTELHPTAKPVLMVSDAILDCTRREDIVLDPFLGSGTSLLAAERVGRRCYGIELDPLYVDTAIERWQKMTRLKAVNPFGETFDFVKAKRRTGS
jgi:DNA modification methylase